MLVYRLELGPLLCVIDHLIGRRGSAGMTLAGLAAFTPWDAAEPSGRETTFSGKSGVVLGEPAAFCELERGLACCGEHHRANRASGLTYSNLPLYNVSTLLAEGPKCPQLSA